MVPVELPSLRWLQTRLGWIKRLSVAAATKGVTNVSSREKLSYPEVYASGSGRHDLCPACFSPLPPTPRKFTVVTLYVLSTRDLFAIAKFLALIYCVHRDVLETYRCCVSASFMID